MIPGWLPLLVLALAACRLTRLIGWDDLEPIEAFRRRLLGRRLVKGSMAAERVRRTYTPAKWPTLEHFLQCSFCLGFWVAAAVYTAWVLAGAPGRLHVHSWVFYGLVPFALGELVGLVSKNWDP